MMLVAPPVASLVRSLRLATKPHSSINGRMPGRLEILGSFEGPELANPRETSDFSSRSLLPMKFRPKGHDGPFVSGGSYCEVGEVGLTYMWAKGRFVARTPSVPPTSNQVLLTLCLGGECEIEGMQSLTLRAGQFVMLPCWGRMAIDSGRELASLSVRVPSDWLAAAMPGIPIESLLCRPVNTDGGFPGLVEDTMVSLWRQRLWFHPATSRSIVDVLGRLLRGAFEEGSRHLIARSPARQALFLAVEQDIDRHLSDAEQMGVDRTAARLGRSTRAIQSALRETGTTFGAMVMNARLARAEQWLRSPLTPYRSITEMALALGFQDLAHFSRRFRDRFGASPRKYRAAIRAI